MRKVAEGFNPAAFSAPQDHNLRRRAQSLYGSAWTRTPELDASLIKDTHFEKPDAELRAEFFNVVNTPHSRSLTLDTRTLHSEPSVPS